MQVKIINLPLDDTYLARDTTPTHRFVFYYCIKEIRGVTFIWIGGDTKVALAELLNNES